ncbi:MAG: Mut7-C RNAse domain-containing protein [Candidatus Bathyarchaeota archaeon]|nr:Mut7-C RNAse domain-containing protein [Candidatus Bathyarchaeum sp.]
MRFLSDGMLGKLARWLRMLGQDVEYYRAADDKKLLELAESEQRVLLTRDSELYQRAVSRGLEPFFVESVDIIENLASLAERFGFELMVDLSVSRCSKCNGLLEVVSKDSVNDKILKATSINYDSFWGCTECGQVYWQGAHWKRILTTLESANSVLNGGKSFT